MAGNLGSLEMVICRSSSHQDLTNDKASGVTLSSRIAYCNACEHSSNSSSSHSLDTGYPTSVITTCDTLCGMFNAVWESHWMSPSNDMFGNPNENKHPMLNQNML